jgi:phosphate starvation-inducible protein PhoH and related proteins
LTELTIPLRSHDEAVLVLGPYDRYAKLLRQDLGIELFTRRGNLRIKGDEVQVQEAQRRIEHLLGKARKGRTLEVRDIESILLDARSGTAPPEPRTGAVRALAGERGAEGQGAGAAAQSSNGGWRRPTTAARSLRSRPVQPRTENQRRYLELIERNDLVFGLGVAGTGKTYLAVAAAVASLRDGRSRRLVITRPVVEAGERLGFLPGDIAAKLNPYMRPIYDALNDQLGYEDVLRLEMEGVIEVAPLAYMRGRTLANSFVILDEGQNTTVGQMKMFLTRLGEHSRMIVTGDPTQSDLDRSVRSGLHDAVRRLRGVQGIGFAEFDRRDIVRHALVESVIRAYEQPVRERADGPRGESPSGDGMERA